MNTRAHLTPQQRQDWEDRQTREGRFITPDLARNELIAECLQDALNDGDGRPRPNALAHHLAKHGLVIVEAASYHKMLAAVQLVGSAIETFVTDMGATEFPPGVWRALRDAVTKIKEL